VSAFGGATISSALKISFAVNAALRWFRWPDAQL